MTLREILARAEAEQIELSVDGDELVLRTASPSVDPVLLGLLRENKQALVELFRSGAPRERLPLVELSNEEIDAVVATVPGGAANVQDIYPLAPLQEGLLFHHLMNPDGDPYVLSTLAAFDTRGRLDAYLGALQAVIDRHDVLRTSIAWEGVREPVQVVWRKAPLEVEEVEVDPAAGDAARQLHARFDPRRHRLDLRRAPLLRGCAAWDPAGGRWLLLLLRHHIVSDHTTLEVLQREVQAHLLGRAHELPAPLPFRNYVAQARLGVSREEHEAYFRALLADVEEPTAPFGLVDAWGDGSGIEEALLLVDPALAERLRARARALGVSAASVCHVAWAQVLARASGRDDVVFGTVLLGRMQGGEGMDRVMGPFINTLPVRVRVGAESAEAGVRAAHRQLTALLRHEHASLVLAQRCSAVRPPAPLFTAFLNYRHSPVGTRAPEAKQAWEGIRATHAQERSNYPVGLSVDDLGRGLGLSAQVPASVGAERVCAMMHRALESLAEALETAPRRALGRLEVLPEAERRRVVEEWNATEAAFPRERCIHELFEAQAERSPGAAAAVFEGAALTYGELDRRANRLAHHLRGHGVGPDVRVGLCVERGLEMVVALLGVLKAGGAYVPLDPSYPEDRLRYMLADSAPAVLLTQAALAGRFGGLDLPVVALDADASSWSGRPETRPERGGLTPDHLAYVIYTSGSTGRPKGVMVRHQGLTGYVWYAVSRYAGEGPATFPLYSSLSFDLTVTSVYVPLVTGGVVVVAPNEEGARSLARVFEEDRADVVKLTPAHLVLLADRDLRDLRIGRLVVGGEDLGAPLARAIHDASGGRLEIYNEYGPTEATVGCVVRRFDPERDVEGSVPIGAPIANARMYVLGGGEPTPVGVAGELYIGGVGLARGYLGRPGLTAERFVPDPFGGEPGARLYRTGDLSRWRADGTLEYLGRIDAQVKVRGYRVEPGEIEARLSEHAAVREAVVVAREDGSGGRRLVAYYVAGAALEVEALRAHLGERLPEYMVPAAYVWLEALPLTPNGKVDRAALPLPEGDAYARRGYEAPAGDTERALAELWAEVLRVERVGRWDHFFELGGHSLLAVILVERMRRRGMHAEVRALFTTPTLADLAAAVGGEAREVVVPPNGIPDACDALTPAMLPLVELSQGEIDSVVAGVPGGARNVQDIYPLAPLQEGILFHHLTSTEGDPYLMSILYGFDGRPRLDAYLAALQAVVGRHDILRTSVAWEGLSEPVQVVWRQARLEVDEVEVDPSTGDVARQLWSRFDPRHHRIDVRRAPLMRVHVARAGDGERWLLLLLLHHLCSDHTSAEVLQGDVEAHLLGRAHELPAPLPFRNFVAQARLGVSRDEHEAYFRALLGDVEEPTAPFGLLEARGDGAGIEEARRLLGAELSARLRERTRALGVSAASVCHLAWARVLARVSGRDDVVFGTVLFGRMQGGEGADRVMGPFINTLPVRLRVGGEGVEAGVRAAHLQLADLLRHEHASLALAQRCSAVRAPAPLFTALLNYRHTPTGARTPAASRAREGMRGVHAQERSNYPVTLSVDDLGDRIGLTAKVPAWVGAERVCALMQRALEGLVEALEEEPGRALARVEVVPDEERRRVVEEWNATEAGYPRERCIHELVEAQAGRTPDAPAVVFEGEALTYGELNRRANRLAHHLRARGVGPDVTVGVCLERSLDLAVALLAVLKAGGAYLPLDPEYPDERLRYMLGDAAPAALLAQSTLAGRFAGLRVPTLSLDADAHAWADRPSTNLEGVGVTPGHLAYVIYTSGSTGRPKGVMNLHRGLVNRLEWGQRAWRLAAGEAVLLKTSLSFDGLVRELFWPLLAGARVVVARPGGHRDPAYLLETIRAEGIGTVNLVPSLLQVLLEDPALEGCRALKRILCGGEALPAALLARVRERLPWVEVHNLYGPSEAATAAVALHCVPEAGRATVPIGGPIANTRLYVLDPAGEPVPAAVVGELYIGGDGVARGYLGRPALTAERFVPDPFAAEPGARLYRTGDLARWLADGRVEFLGRNDDQVKVRGFRIELGEIEAALASHPAVREAVAAVREDAPGDRRLVAYWVGGHAAAVEALRAHLGERLPEYMVPAAYVRLDAMPRTPNGKLDRRALPAPEGDAFARRGYEAPLGEKEEALAEVWAELLGVERVGRWDHFFELGGHSLLAVRLIERMRRRGLHAEIRTLFTTPTLADLAAAVGGESLEVPVPPNAIPDGCEAITPEMLPLVELSQSEIEVVVAHVPGGAPNVQDIYPLAPLQEGMLFHNLVPTGGDPFVVAALTGFESRERLDAYLAALQAVIDRHDILRTSVVWEGLREPVQVVWRQARLPVEEVELDPAAGDVARQLWARFYPANRMDVRRAPLFRAHVARYAGDRWVLLLRRHHLTSDHTASELLHAEVRAHLRGRADQLPPPLPFRGYVAQARLGVSREEHEAYFRALLAGVEETTAPFGLLDALGDGSASEEARLLADAGLAARLRERARALGVSAASVCHVAWARVVARVSGRDDVVFGTVLFGRMRGGEGADRVLGPFINTLPVRFGVRADGVEASVRAMHGQLAELLRHEHASLALAQRCSAVEAPAPLFTALLNYRHTPLGARPPEAERAADRAVEARVIFNQERSNYPVLLSVDDLGEQLGLTAQVPASVGAARVCAMMNLALEGVVAALESAPERSLARVEVLPEDERRQVVEAWNATAAAYPRERCIHELFEAWVERTPDAVAVVAAGEALTYGELNAHANQLAHHLRERGLGPDVRAGLCVERGLEMVVGVLAVLKAGGAYVPLDPTYPEDRLRHMLTDSEPGVLLTQESLKSRFDGLDVPVVTLDSDAADWSGRPRTNPRVEGLSSNHLAYVIYTSGSTGLPKGVAIGHRNAVNLLTWGGRLFEDKGLERTLLSTSLNFDLAVFELFVPLAAGASVHVVRDALELADTDADVTLVNTVPSAMQALVEIGRVPATVRTVNLAGEPLKRVLVERIFATTGVERVCNLYGPTETTTYSTGVVMERAGGFVAHIGHPIANTQTYVLDASGEPAPVGVVGELYIAGDGVARGYLNRPELTAERFVADPFGQPGARMYRTGDLARWQADGTLEFLGRNDAQVKVRGFRIELGEIEARLAEHAAVREAVVVAREDGPGNKRLIAYVVPDRDRVDEMVAPAEGGSESLEAEHEGDWLTAWELTYESEPSAGVDRTFDISGWNSSYTGEPIPADEMREWVESTVARIQSLSPESVLELGCGTGLLLSRVAPGCRRYVGTDFSSGAVRDIEALRRERPELAHVEAMRRTADDFSGFEPGSFDTVIINSVVQYLPSLEYLSRVLEGAVRVLKPGGRVFVGDVRDLRLLDAFHTAVETYRSPASRSVGEWRERVEQARLQEAELVIDPGFFWTLGQELNAVARVETLTKRGFSRNELTEFRYDVVLHVAGGEGETESAETSLDWDGEGLTLETLRARLEKAGGDAVVVHGIPNARVSGALKQLALRRDPGELETVEEVRRRAVADGVDPEALWRLGEALGWSVEVRLADSDDAGRVDARFTRGAEANGRRGFPTRKRLPRRELRVYGSDPLRGRRTGALVRALRGHLGERLPEHMVPASYLFLDALPLTPNGKVDRKALPSAEGDAHTRSAYEAPVGGKEATMAELWMEVLGAERVSRHDNFFELGGHSLLAVRLIERIRRRGLHADVQTLLTAPTLAGMAALAGEQHSNIVESRTP